MLSFRLPLLCASLALALGLPSLAAAENASCQSMNDTTLRYWKMDKAYACGPASGRFESSADIEALGSPFNFDSWELREKVTSQNAATRWLDVEVVAGEWASGDVYAKWELAPGFWEDHDVAVFSVRVGDGADASLSDWATFIITPGQSSGTLFFSQVSKAAAPSVAGLSEIRLWTPQGS